MNPKKQKQVNKKSPNDYSPTRKLKLYNSKAPLDAVGSKGAAKNIRRRVTLSGAQISRFASQLAQSQLLRSQTKKNRRAANFAAIDSASASSNISISKKSPRLGSVPEEPFIDKVDTARSPTFAIVIENYDNEDHDEVKQELYKSDSSGKRRKCLTNADRQRTSLDNH